MCVCVHQCVSVYRYMSVPVCPVVCLCVLVSVCVPVSACLCVCVYMLRILAQCPFVCWPSRLQALGLCNCVFASVLGGVVICEISGLWGYGRYGVMGLRGYGAAGLRGCGATRLRGYEAVWLRGCGAAGLRGYRFLGFKDMGCRAMASVWGRGRGRGCGLPCMGFTVFNPAYHCMHAWIYPSQIDRYLPTDQHA